MLDLVREKVAQAKATVATYESKNPYRAGRVRQVVGGVLIADGLVGLENPFDGRSTRPGILGGAVSEPDEGKCSQSVEFVVDGTTYVAGAGYSSTSFCSGRAGQEREVHYNSADPHENRIGLDVVRLVGGVFAGVGLLLLTIGLVMVSIRAVSIVAGIAIWRSGSRMVKANPPAPDDETFAQDLKERFTALVMSGRARMDDLVDLARGQDAPSPAVVAPPVPAGPVAPPVITAGWYATADGGHERWHDGTDWTDQTRPRA